MRRDATHGSRRLWLQVALLRESPKASRGIPDDLRHEGLPPRERGGRAPSLIERLQEISPVKIVAITLALVGLIFFVRRSIVFNVIYEVGPAPGPAAHGSLKGWCNQLPIPAPFLLRARSPALHDATNDLLTADLVASHRP